MKKRLRIFVGSSSWYAPKEENKPTYEPKNNRDVENKKTIDRKVKPSTLAKKKLYPLARVFKGIIDAGFEPCPWWQQDIWTDAESFFYSLRKASQEHDGGIFILGPDDSVTTGKSLAKSFSATRDNVVFEFGMFLAAKGRERTYAIFDKSTKNRATSLKVMSDLQGINYPELIDEHLEHRIEEFFAQPAGDLRLDERTMYANPDLWRSKRNREFEYWKSKGLYVGTQSAVLWERIESHRSYKRYIGFLHQCIDKIHKKDKNIYKGIDNIVSFGPGSGITDLALVSRINVHNETICYVPIDINPVLASMAATKVSSDRLIRVPFIIVDDFESNHSMIKDVIDGNTHQIGHRNLFVMLGVTFSNIGEPESLFFLKIRNWMNKGDCFLLDVNIYDEDASEDEDFVKDFKDELLYRGDSAPEYSSLLANAMANKHPQSYHLVTSASGEGCKNRAILYAGNKKVSLNSIFEFAEISNEDAKQYSHVKGTRVLICRVKDDEGAADVFILRRYRFNAIKEELEKHFEVDAFNGIRPNNGNVRRALFLLRLPDSD